MNIQNLSQEEIKSLHTLLGKMLEEPKVEKDLLEKMIAEIMEEFNFAKVLKTMWALEWRWAIAEGGIPTMDELKATVERLLRAAAEARLDSHKDEHWEMPIASSTGGFQATAYCDEDKTKITGLELAFVVPSWASETVE